MRIWQRHHGMALALAVLLALAVIAPANAAYDKAYRFALPGHLTESDVKAVRVITNAMEIVTTQYDGWRNPYFDGTVGYPVIGGVYCTRIAYNELRPPQTNPSTGDPWTWDLALKIGWTTSDSECRLRDLVWVKTEAAGGGTEPVIDPVELGSVPGGGELIYQDPPGQWVWRIWNDPPSDPSVPPTPLPLQDVEVLEFDEKLDQEKLAVVTQSRGAADAVAFIEPLLEALRLEVVAAADEGDLSRGWARSLLTKVGAAAADLAAGLEAFEPPVLDERRALSHWHRAAQHVRTLASQIRNQGGRKTTPASWITQANAIAAAIPMLPDGPPAEAKSSADAAMTNGGSIPPGGYVDYLLEDVQPGDAVVMHGVVEQNGVVVLEWAEQVVIPDDVDPPALNIDPAPDFYDTYGFGHYNNDPGTVTLTCLDGRPAAIHYGHTSDPLLGDFTLIRSDPVTQASLQPGKALVCLAQDVAGNISPPAVLVFRNLWVDDDWTGPGNCGGHEWLVDAFNSIQDALNAAASGDTIVVRDGTYTPPPGGILFQGKAVVLRSEGGPANCIIDGQGSTRGFSFWDTGEKEDSVVDGFTITNCYASDGGAIIMWHDTWPTIINNVITGNHAGYRGGGIYVGYDSYGVIANNNITNNTAEYGGGLAFWTNGNSRSVTSNVIAGNVADYGGAIYCYHYSHAKIGNNTVVGNVASLGTAGGIGAELGSVPEIANCIVWGNGDDLYGCSATYSCIEDPDPGTGNIHGDPSFVNAGSGDLHLLPTSPCIDAGDSSALPLGATTDLDGNARVVGTAVDMGAYEYQGEGASSSNGLTITSASAAATGAGAEVIFTLSRDADVAVTVLNIAGRPIRRVATDHAGAAGRNSVLWNARSDNGLRVPNGAYLIQIEAKAKDGSASRALTAIRIAQ